MTDERVTASMFIPQSRPTVVTNISENRDEFRRSVLASSRLPTVPERAAPASESATEAEP